MPARLPCTARSFDPRFGGNAVCFRAIDLVNMSKKAIFIASAIGATVGGFVCYKEFLQGCHYTQMDDLTGRTVIITGANTGIGKETAKEFCKRGAKVIMACRNMERCRQSRRDVIMASRFTLAKMTQEGEERKKAKVFCEELDLASFESIRNFSDRMQKQKKINFLINNAGTMRNPERELTKDGLEKQIGINHFGHFLLTNLLLPKLIASAPSRVVVLSSTAHYRGDLDLNNLNWEHDYSPGGAYNASKLANVLFVRHLAKRLTGARVTVNAVHPGLVYTDLFRHLSVMHSISSYIFAPLMWLFLKTPRAGAQTTLYVALSSELEDVSGRYFSDCADREPAEKAVDDETAERLWNISEKWTRLNGPGVVNLPTVP